LLFEAGNSIKPTSLSEKDFTIPDAVSNVSSETTIDQEAEDFSEASSMSFPTLTAQRPVRNAITIEWTAAGRSSESVLQELTAAAARAPVFSPTRHESSDCGYNPEFALHRLLMVSW
jgi:hypothetical protein